MHDNPFRNHCANDIWYSNYLPRKQLQVVLAKWQVLGKMGACNKPPEMIQLLWVNPQSWGLFGGHWSMLSVLNTM